MNFMNIKRVSSR